MSESDLNAAIIQWLVEPNPGDRDALLGRNDLRGFTRVVSENRPADD